MPTYKNSNITDFFKAYKRPLPDDGESQSQPARKSRSITPPRFPGSLPIRSCENTPSKPRASITSSTAAHENTDASSRRWPKPGADTISTAIAAPENGAVTAQLPVPSSQGLIPTSSQRVVKNGEAMVTNSDEEGSDTDESLGDIDELLRARRPPPEQISSPLTEPDSSILTPTQQSTPAPQPETAIRKGRTRGANAIAKRSSPDDLSSTPKYKFDLASLVKRAQTDGVSEQGIAKARSLLATLEHSGEPARALEDRDTKKPTHIDAGLFTSMMKEGNDEYDTKRLMLAIERTEALQQDLSWSFFEDEQEPWDSEPQGFPDGGMEAWHSISHGRYAETPLAAQLNRLGPALRQQAFLGGSFGALAANPRLPDEILIWLVDSVSLEARDDLRYSYVHTLKDAGRSLTPVLNSSRIDAAFRRLGARCNALKITNSIVPTARSRSKDGKAYRRPRLMSLINVLGDLAIDLELSSRRYVICLLCRLLVDHTIPYDSQAIVTIEEALDSLVSAISDETFDTDLESISNTLFSTIADVTLSCQLVQILPAFSSRLTLFRRRLAVAFFFEDSTYLSIPQQDLLNLGSVSHRLTTSKFRIDRDTNYTELAALISILNIGVGSGDPPLAGLNHSAEQAFNRDIDELTYQIKSISTNIIDTGASQLKRTEAKEVLEAFNFRLMYAVRTRAKAKNTMFKLSETKEREKNDLVWNKWRTEKGGVALGSVDPEKPAFAV